MQVVTKFGLGHEKHVNLPVDLALILNRLKNRFLHKGNNLSNPINKKYIFNERIITLDQLQQAFFNSQKNLRTEVIYGYLAHECIFNFLTDEAKSFLYNLKSQGGIKKIGIGSNSTSILHYNKFMIKNKFSTFLLIVYYLTLSNFAFARVITVDRCTIPFDFTIGSICVLGTLSLWILVPIVLGLIFVPRLVMLPSKMAAGPCMQVPIWSFTFAPM